MFPRLIAITDLEQLPAALLEARVEALLARAEPRSVMLQLRDRATSARERLALGSRLAKLTRRYRQLFAVNDRVDLAQLLGADALHLGEHSVSTADARALLPSIWISRACHDARAAAAIDADALLVSPVFAVRKGAAALGLSELQIAAELARARETPALVYALGGVTPERARRALMAGAHGVAAIGAALGEASPLPLLDALGIRAR